MGWIEQGETVRTLKVLVIGDYGTGKSYFASTFPDPIYLLDFDGGKITYSNKKVYIPDCLTDPNLNPQQIWAKLEEELDQIIKGEHPEGKFETVVLDSLTTAARVAMDIAIMLKPLAVGAAPSGKVHYMVVKVYMDKLLDKLRQLQTNVVSIAHVQYDKNEITGEIVAAPNLTGQLKTFVPACYDEVYFSECFFDPKKGAEYKLLISPRGFKRARSRLKRLYPSIPDDIPNNYEALKNYIEGGK